MGVGLQPLEFSECLADSPQFRENLHNHEKELERTSQQIKRLIKEVKDTVHAAKRLRAAQLALATSMEQLEFTCIGASMTDDELAISHSLSHLATLIRTVEDERDRMLGRAHEQIIEPLERFRKEHIGAVKEGKKKFDKKTAKFCQTQERTLGLSTKKPDNVFQEADAGMEMAERDFCAASLEYVFLLQAVQERKKFELVETLLGFVFGWWTFHHQAHEVHNDAEPLVRDLQLRIQRTRTNFEETSKQTESLMKKMMEMRQTCAEEGPGGGAAGNAASGLTRAGYLFLMERKAFGTAWTKHYCTYERTSSLLTLTPYNQINVKTTGPTDNVCVCGARRAGDAVERRFCWEALPVGGERPPLTLQALSERDRTRWLRALRSAEREERDAVPPAYALDPGGGGGESGYALDEAGFTFVRRIISILEARGLDEQGLYRVAGVASKVSRLVACAADPRRLPASLSDPLEWETKTLTSALKSYLRALPEPLCTRRLHARWVSAAKREARADRLGAMHALLHALPAPHRDMLALVVRHLREVAARAAQNLMSASNLAVCFGPTLLRPERETVASIMELKFCNVVVETLIDNYDLLFLTPPPAEGAAPASSATIASIPPNGHLRAESAPPPPPPPQPPAHAEAEWGSARYAALHHRLLHHYPALPPPPRGGVSSIRSDTSSTDSGSSASPPPHPPPPAHPPRALPHQASGAPAAPAPSYLRHPRYTRVRTLYACLGESEGELSFEPNQIITNVSASAEPGWLTGTLNGATGLVPENYVEPLP